MGSQKNPRFLLHPRILLLDLKEHRALLGTRIESMFIHHVDQKNNIRERQPQIDDHSAMFMIFRFFCLRLFAVAFLQKGLPSY